MTQHNLMCGPIFYARLEEGVKDHGYGSFGIHVAEPRVLEQFRARGIKSEKRILFSDFAPKENYLLRSLAADIFLDNGGTMPGQLGSMRCTVESPFLLNLQGARLAGWVPPC